MIGTTITLTMTIAFVVIGLGLGINNAFAQSSEQNEKLMACHEYKGQDVGDNKRILVNCIEFAHSDYDTIEEFIEEEHPELKP